MNGAWCLVFAFLFTSLLQLRAEKVDNRNFAIDTFQPTPNEVRLAEEHAHPAICRRRGQSWDDPMQLPLGAIIIATGLEEPVGCARR